MANIPIDLRPFVPRGFQLQHIEGRTAVHRVVVPRRPRRHEDFAIVTINSMPQGEVHFENVRGVLEDFLLNEAWVGLGASNSALLGKLMSDLHMSKTETI
jgi:hypothetical protein